MVAEIVYIANPGKRHLRNKKSYEKAREGGRSTKFFFFFCVPGGNAILFGNRVVVVILAAVATKEKWKLSQNSK